MAMDMALATSAASVSARIQADYAQAQQQLQRDIALQNQLLRVQNSINALKPPVVPNYQNSELPATGSFKPSPGRPERTSAWTTPTSIPFTH
jgi:hypothetical protein